MSQERMTPAAVLALLDSAETAEVTSRMTDPTAVNTLVGRGMIEITDRRTHKDPLGHPIKTTTIKRRTR